MTQVFFGEKLRLARQFHGFSLAELGEKVGVTRQFIQQLEADAKIPNIEMAEALAAALQVTTGFFESPVRNSVKIEQTHFRRLKSTPISLIHQILAHGTMLERLISYFDSQLNLQAVNFPEIHVHSDEDIEDAASHCRSYWHLSNDKPIQNMTRVLENAGAVVALFNGVSNKIDALSMARARPIVVRSSEKESLCRQRFDLAHECAHLVIHQGIETGDNTSERQANNFAGAFLLPRKPFMQEFPVSNRMDWQSIFAMKLKWKVSAQAIIRRAHHLQLIDAAQYKKAMIQLQRNGQKKQEKFDDIMPLEKPVLLQKCFDVLKQNQRFYFTGIASDINIEPSVLSKLTYFLDFAIDEDGKQDTDESYRNVIQFSGKSKPAASR